ncbi:MAG TPA: Ig-like domain-containing protein [Stenomitos sp.]
MSIAAKGWSHLALIGLSLALLACSEEGPTTSGGSHLGKPSPTPTAESSATPTPSAAPSPTPTPSPTVTGLMIVPSNVMLSSDPSALPSSRAINLAAVAVLSNNQQVSATVLWSVSPPGLVSINNAGYVSAIDNAPSGTATVKATSGALQATAIVQVTGKPITVDSVSLSSTGLTLYAPAADGLNTAGLVTTAQLSAEVTMSDLSTSSAVTWTSSNDEVATISPSGLVTTVGAGTATLTAHATQDSSKTATCPITVKAQGLVDVTVE